MAEILGIVASTAQLLDGTIKVISLIARLTSDFRNVPPRVSTGMKQLQQSKVLLEMIQNDFHTYAYEPASVSQGGIPGDRTGFANIIVAESLAQIQMLDEILRRLSPEGKSRVQRIWRTLVSIATEDEVVKIFDQIERSMSSLRLWHNHETLLLMQRNL
jgi:hypothetical protein